MAFHFEQIQQSETTIYLLNYDDYDPADYLELLTRDEQERYFSFHHIKRKKEFVATRILRHELFGFEHIHYDEHGAPSIDQEGFISVSHCKGIVGIAVNKDYQVGLDLETPGERILQLAPKFLSQHEKRTFDISDGMVLTKIWSAKEALYKLAGRKKIIFASELLLEDASDNSWSGRIKNPDHDRIVKLHIFEHNGVVVTYNEQAIEIVER